VAIYDTFRLCGPVRAAVASAYPLLACLLSFSSFSILLFLPLVGTPGPVIGPTKKYIFSFSIPLLSQCAAENYGVHNVWSKTGTLPETCSSDPACRSRGSSTDPFRTPGSGEAEMRNGNTVVQWHDGEAVWISIYTLIVLNTLNAEPVPTTHPGICGCQWHSLTCSM
jgi:hypothetical protein